MLARSQLGGQPEQKFSGDTVEWGGKLREILGGGSVTVKSLSQSGAELSYEMNKERVIVAGGGTLKGGGTILITNDGRIIRIPPGDPFERVVVSQIDRVSALVDRIRDRRLLEHHSEGNPEVVAGVAVSQDGTAILYTHRSQIVVPSDHTLAPEIRAEADKLSGLVRRLQLRSPAPP